MKKYPLLRVIRLQTHKKKKIDIRGEGVRGFLEHDSEIFIHSITIVRDKEGYTMAIFEKLYYKYKKKASIEDQFPIHIDKDEDVPEIARYNTYRVMPVVRWSPWKRDYMFPSVESYRFFQQRELNNKKVKPKFTRFKRSCKGGDGPTYRDAETDDEFGGEVDEFPEVHGDYDYRLLKGDGLGIPLFESVYQKSIYSLENTPFLVIYKYIILPRGEPEPYKEYDVIEESKTHILYRIPFCTVDRIKQKRCKHKYLMYFNTMHHSVEIDTRYIPSETVTASYKGKLDGRRFKWSLKTVPFYRGKLTIDIKDIEQEENQSSDVDVVSMDMPVSTGDSYNQNEEEEDAMFGSHVAKSTLIEPSDDDKFEGKLCGYYTKLFESGYFKKIAREVDLVIGEWNDKNSLGIQEDVPEYTQLFACQTLLLKYLHFIKTENDQNRTRVC